MKNMSLKPWLLDIDITREVAKDHALSSIFRGCFPPSALEHLDFDRDQDHAMVLNSDDPPGQHWLCLFYESKTKYIFVFDSLMEDWPNRNEFNRLLIEKFIKRLTDDESKICSHNINVQSPQTTICGYYCLWFLKQIAKEKYLSRGYDIRRFFEIIKSQFSLDLHQNDAFIFEFFYTSLSVEIHVNQLCKRLHIELRIIRRSSYFLDPNSVKQLVISRIFSELDYCNFYLSYLPNELTEKLKRIKYQAGRLITKTKHNSHVTSLHVKIHWFAGKHRVQRKLKLRRGTRILPERSF